MVATNVRHAEIAELTRIYCADIGSQARDRFGWAVLGEGRLATSGTTLDSLATNVAGDLNAGHPVSLGFECPLFVPITLDPAALTSARIGERSRPWCAGAGAGALATGLTQVVWILDRIRQGLRAPVPATLVWNEFMIARRGLFLWEAFVTGQAKGTCHTDDAELGARAFYESLPDPERANAIQSSEVHSLIGAAMLRTGWSDHISVLKQPCVVVRA